MEKKDVEYEIKYTQEKNSFILMGFWGIIIVGCFYLIYKHYFVFDSFEGSLSPILLYALLGYIFVIILFIICIFKFVEAFNNDENKIYKENIFGKILEINEVEHPEEEKIKPKYKQIYKWKKK